MYALGAEDRPLEPDTYTWLSIPDGICDGIPYENISNIFVIGEARELGELLKCAFYVLLKKGDFSDWANYIEIFGMPMIVTKYDTYDEKTKAQLTKMMEEAGIYLLDTFGDYKLKKYHKNTSERLIMIFK